jgi:16S rRNA processing protein RimM
LIPISNSTELRVGRLVRAHGLKGAIKLELYTDSPETRFAKGAVLRLQVPETSPWFGQTLTVGELRWYNQAAVVFFEGVTDRSQAETLIRAILLIDQPITNVAPEPDAWYDHQLVGLKVLREGVEIGRVTRVDHLPAQDLLAIDFEGREVLLPFVKALVPKVDSVAGFLEITPPGGLFEPLEGELEAAEAAETADAAAPETEAHHEN